MSRLPWLRAVLAGRVALLGGGGAAPAAAARPAAIARPPASAVAAAAPVVGHRSFSFALLPQPPAAPAPAAAAAAAAAIARAGPASWRAPATLRAASTSAAAAAAAAPPPSGDGPPPSPPPPAPPHQGRTDDEYHEAADELLERLAERLEAYVEDADVEDGDVEYSQGVLTVRLGRHGTYVLNKQTPNRQVWLSSPVSGPFRYGLRAPNADAGAGGGGGAGAGGASADEADDGAWVYARDGHSLEVKLERELEGLVGRPTKGMLRPGGGPATHG